MNIKRTVIVTGGTKGIGAAISRAFCSNGYYVVIGSRRNSGLVTELGERIMFQPTDVREPSDVHALVKAALDWTGQLDVFVNNAGISAWRPVEKVDEDFWDRVIDTNMKGTFFGCQAAATI